MLRVIEYFAKSIRSLKAIENGNIRKPEYGFIFAFHSNHSCSNCGLVVSCIISEIGRKSRFFIPPAFDAPVKGSTSEYCHAVW